MEYRFLGKTGLKVSEICFGPGNSNIFDDAEGQRIIEAAFDKVVEKLRPLAERRGETLARFAVAWVLSTPVVSGVLVGANNLEQLKDCAGAAGHKLSAEELCEVDEIRGVLPGCVTAPSAVEQRWMDQGYRQV